MPESRIQPNTATLANQPVIAVLHPPKEPVPGLQPLESIAELRFATDAESLREALEGAQILMVTDFRCPALEQCWDAANNLEWVHATSAGVDALLFPALVESEVTLTNARGVFDRGIAEYVLGVILLFAKDTLGNIELMREHKWRHRDTERILDKRVLVVGAGSIGREIARLAGAAGMQVEGIARSARDDPDFEAVYASEQLHQRLAEADYVVVATPLTEQTRGLFGATEFEVMPEQARFINIARGPIVDTDALVEALREGRIAGAALDVFEQEPLPPEHPLWELSNVMISAHMAGDFIGWREALSEQFIENFQRWQSDQPLENIVDKQRGYASSKE